MLRNLLALSVVFLVAACGTVAEPVFRQPQTVAEADTGESVAVAATPTPTPVPPTATPVPPTATPVPTLEPTAVPTEAPTQEASTGAVVIGSADYGADDVHKFAVDNFANAARGEALFAQTLEVNEQQWACATCHSVADNSVKIGPSLRNVGLTALTRVEGEGPYTYLYNSILHSQAYVVPQFVGMTMMPIYGSENGSPATLNNSQVYDLIKYLLTLND
jgi:cytochrome c553